MTEDENILKKRFAELSAASSANYYYEQTAFLNLNEQSILNSLTVSGKIKYVRLFGGYIDAERQIAIFGNEDEIGYECTPNIDIIKIAPVSEKFSEELTHRDYLGAVLSLGIKREMTGDILISGKTAFMFVISSISKYITENLNRIRHTDIKAELTDNIPEGIIKEPEEKIFFISSERLDCIISAAYNISRAEAKNLCIKERVFINSKLTVSSSKLIFNGDLISVRGFGRIKYSGIQKQTKKGRLAVMLEIY